MTIQQLPRLVTRGSLVLAPALLALAALAASAVPTGASAQVAEIAHHPHRYYLFTLAMIASTALCAPVFHELMQLGRRASPRLAIVGASLAQVAVMIGVVDAGTQLVLWQMGAPAADPGQMAALVDRYEHAAGASLFYLVGGLCFVAGSSLLAAALWRAHAAPRWAALCLPVGVIANIAAFAAGSRPFLLASALVLLAGLAPVAVRPDGAAATAAVADAA